MKKRAFCSLMVATRDSCPYVNRQRRRLAFRLFTVPDFNPTAAELQQSRDGQLVVRAVCLIDGAFTCGHSQNGSQRHMTTVTMVQMSEMGQAGPECFRASLAINCEAESY